MICLIWYVKPGIPLISLDNQLGKRDHTGRSTTLWSTNKAPRQHRNPKPKKHSPNNPNLTHLLTPIQPKQVISAMTTIMNYGENRALSRVCVCAFSTSPPNRSNVKIYHQTKHSCTQSHKHRVCATVRGVALFRGRSEGKCIYRSRGDTIPSFPPTSPTTLGKFAAAGRDFGDGGGGSVCIIEDDFSIFQTTPGSTGPRSGL